MPSSRWTSASASSPNCTPPIWPNRVREKQRITSSLREAVGKEEPVPFLLAAKQAGEF